MGILIEVDFGKRSLKQAKQYLGAHFFKEALFKWTIEQLEKTTMSCDACAGDAIDAYNAILRFRRSQQDQTPAPDNIVSFPVTRKAA